MDRFQPSARAATVGSTPAFEAGEEVVITRRGRIVARLVPPSLAFDRERSRRAVQKIREMRKGVTLGDLRIKDLINEGRE